MRSIIPPLERRFLLKKKLSKRLAVNKETIKNLDEQAIVPVVGGTLSAVQSCDSCGCNQT
ncbi:MAG: hypothetical protein QOJ16_4543 [Acidobacteriota bacterium]|jgi:hypothetical protein|nr:hypothetical protein [Acidobacteriota bacterium]